MTFVIFVFDLFSLVYSLCTWVSLFLSMKSYYLSKKKKKTVCEITWVLNLLKDFQINHCKSVLPFCENQATLHISSNLVFLERTKHINTNSHKPEVHLKGSIRVYNKRRRWIASTVHCIETTVAYIVYYRSKWMLVHIH